ncbi:MAG TPA: CCA tRNA nucleotidyltransferase [Acidimicrobiia bacterium]|jgi:poly(A) polymerase|nr:CCA tRNA nucleotidyltransferase [Acidimicrobiia bacterium]
MEVPARLRAYYEAGSPTLELAQRLTAAGHECYLVGGTVRDAFLGATSPDVDLSTDATPDEVQRLASGWADDLWLQGARFGTVAMHKGGLRLEVTTYRADVYRPESRKPTVSYGTRIEEDLVRRDFTINAMALRLPEPVLVDPHGGAADLAARVLRTPQAPAVSFEADPLRMLRAARFVAAFTLTPRPELVDAMGTLRHRLEIVSPERVRDELNRLLRVADPSVGLWLLCETHLADEFVPELNAMRLEQDPIHTHKDVLAHTIAVVANTDPAHLTVRLAALFHDVGKPKTRSIGPDGVSFHHHEVVGARMAEERLRALRYSNECVHDVTTLVYLHLRIHTYAMGWSDRAVRRYVRDAGPLLGELNELQRADCTTRNRRKAASLDRRMNELEERIAALRAREELDAIRPPLDGREVMAYLGVPPSPVVGEALDFLLEARLDEGPIEHDDACARLDRWARDRGITPAGPRDPGA